jgi:hypothetical protein
MLSSSIAWIDFSEQDRRTMMEVVSLFKQRDTRDELGLGSIRDAFADLFFPGTTTLQTRARYFLFVPWLYHDYERRQVSSSKVADRLKRDEITLIQALQTAGDSDGVIGKVSGASLHRFPASIYWNGLRRWGILRYPGAQSQYHRWLDRFYERQRSRQFTEDHGEPVEGWGDGNWDPGLPQAPPDFPGQADFQITPAEAAYLRERVLLSCPDSLLATLLDCGKPVEDVAFIWQHPQSGEFPGEQQAWIAHARNFSQVMHGAILLYNLMLAELSQSSDLVDWYKTGLATWQDELEACSAVLAAWEREAFWRLVTGSSQIPGRTRAFVSVWLRTLFTDGQWRHLATSREARALVRDRETWLKRGRSRFESQRHLEMWSGVAGIARLDYRWPIARRITNDILRGFNPQ